MRAYFKTMRKLKQLFRRRKASAKLAEGGGVTIEGDPGKYPDGSWQQKLAETVQAQNEMAQEADPDFNVPLNIPAENVEAISASVETTMALEDKGLFDLSSEEQQEYKEAEGVIGESWHQHQVEMLDAGAMGLPWQDDEGNPLPGHAEPSTPRDSDQGGGEDGDEDAKENAEIDKEIGDAKKRIDWLKDRGAHDDEVAAVEKYIDDLEGSRPRKPAPDDEPSGPRKRCPKGSRKDDSGTCQKYSEKLQAVEQVGESGHPEDVLEEVHGRWKDGAASDSEYSAAWDDVYGLDRRADAYIGWALNGDEWNTHLLGKEEGNMEKAVSGLPPGSKDALRGALKDAQSSGGGDTSPDDKPSTSRKRCPKGSHKNPESGSCEKFEDDPAPKKKTLRERLGAKKKCDSGCPDDNDGRQAKQFKAPPGREAQVKALKKEDVKNPYAVAWSSHDAKNSETYAPICFRDNQLPGGDFDAVQNEDGTWNIGIDKDIPIMGTVQEVGVKGNERPIGIKWLRAALRKHRALEEQPGGAYYAPVHLRHHSENSDQDETIPAGFLRLNRIAPAFDGGDNQAAIFATLYNVPDDIYQQIKARKWAFRSVEVASWDKPQISSLSLLNTEAPFFKYGLTTIGKETPAQAVEVLTLEAAAPALALCESGAGGSILFNFSEARRMAEEKIKEEIEIEEDLDLNDEDVDVDVDVDEDDEGATLAEVAGMMRELMRRLDDEVEDEEIVEEVRDKRNEDVPVDIAASEGKMAAMLSEISGRVSGLESNQRKGRQRQALASYVEKSLGKLSGYNLPEKLGDTMTKMAQTAGGNYKKLLDQFVATFKATASRDEDLATLDDFEQSISIGQGDEALAKFAQKGEASLTNARKHLRTFKSLQDKGVRFADGVDDPANFIDILTNETNTNTEN